MNLQQTIDQVATSTGIDPATAEHAVGTVLNVLSQELDPGQVASIFAKLPGADALAQAHPLQQASQGGLFGAIAGAVLGSKGSALVAGVTELEGLGLSATQLEQIGTSLKAYVQKNGGAGVLQEIMAAIPGLSKILG